jgi:hypothetical protein
VTVSDLRCDRCGALLTGPTDDEAISGSGGVRFLYHPGDPLLKDDSGMLCGSCWTTLRGWLGDERPQDRCAVCGERVPTGRSLHLHRAGDPVAWQLCVRHAVAFLNGLRTVEPKLDVRTLTWPVRRRPGGVRP